MGWIQDHKFTFILMTFEIQILVAIPLVVYGPTWISTLFVLTLLATPILAVIWLFRT
ncbi:MAG: hypothetical protein O3C10_13520 [Chloroflexi bacterium]|nr:hypothetical protein [Chloroflexota bacterium]